MKHIEIKGLKEFFMKYFVNAFLFQFLRIEEKPIRCTEVKEFTNEGIQLIVVVLQDSFVYQKKLSINICG